MAALTFIILALSFVLSAGDGTKQCNDVEYLINDKTVSNSTLYLPVNKPAAIGCRKCAGGPPTWKGHKRKEIYNCTKNDNDTVLCFETDGLINYLKFISFTKSLAGNYKCSRTFVWIDVLLEITTHPQDKLVPVNSVVNFTCTSSISSNVTFLWTHNGAPISGSSTTGNTSILTITSVRNSDTGSYVCTVRNGSLSVMSNTATLTVYGEPMIVQQPMGGDIIKKGNMTITLMCKAVGLGTLVYSWERINYGSTWTTVSKDNTTSYTTDTTLPIGWYVYRCIVSNEAGSVVSKQAIVNVYGPLNITTHPTSQLINISMSVTLKCNGTGRGSITYQWETSNINGGQWMNISDSNNKTLVVRNLEQSQQYRCVVSNEDSSNRSDVATVTVLKITTQPVNLTVIALEDSKLNCLASVDDVTYLWHRVSGSVPSRSSGQNSNMFTIPRIIPPDEGMYYCIASKESVRVESNRALIRVDDQLIITINPNNLIIGKDKPAQFTTTASGINMNNFKYQWRKRGSSNLPHKVSGVNGSVLRIPDCNKSDEGEYYCIVTNEWNRSVESDNAILTVFDVPVVMVHPKGDKVPVGRNITLMCRASSPGILTYSWERRSSGTSWTTVSNDNTTSYTTDTTLAIGQYLYRCTVNNDAGSVVSNKAIVNVYGPPTITTHPSSQLTNISMSVTLDCEGTGRGSITYQWETSNIDGGQWMNISDSNNKTLVVRNLKQSQQYRCVVSNEAGSTRSDVATITVLKITTQPVNLTVIVLEDIKLSCSASVDDVTYSWHRVSSSVPSRSSGQSSNMFTIPRIIPPDEGMYYCMASKESVRVESNRALIRVDDQLAITISPNNLMISKGKPAQFTATASGINMNNFTYQWRKRGSNSLPDKVSGVTGTMLTIPDCNKSDEGQYYCIVTNEWNRSVESDNAILTIFDVPIVTDQPKGGNVPEGKSINLVCRASSPGAVTYSWERKNPDNKRWRTVGNDNTSYTTDTTLAIGQYMYRCRVSNDAGSVVSNIVAVNVYGPPTITIHPANHSITVRVRVNLNCKGIGRGSLTYQWETSNINGAQWMNISNNNNKRLVVRNLEQSQQYRCVVSNEAGSTRSNVATITVLKITTHPVSFTTVTALQDVTLNCSASADDVTYSWHRVNDSVFSQNTQMLIISQATPHNEGMYYCMASKERISVQSNRAVVKVDDKLSVHVKPNNSVTGKGRIAHFTAIASGISTNERNFRYQWRKRGSNSLPNKVSGIDGTVLTIPDVLESDEGQYYCIVINEWDRSVESDNIILIVQEKSSPPRAFRITHINVNAFHLNWSAPMNPHGRIHHYIVHYNSSGQSEQAVNVTNFNGTYILVSLRPYTVYSVYMTAVTLINGTGELLEGVKSETVNRRTLAGKPVINDTIVTSLQAHVINNNTLNNVIILINLPVIDAKNGPFSHLYVVVINSSVIGSTKRTISSVEDITTNQLLDESMKASSLYYVAAVVNANQYIPNHRMRYYLGAGDNTTDAEGRMLHNKELKNGLSYFFRVFSVNSTLENEISSNTFPESISLEEPQVSDEDSGNSSSSSVVGPIVGVLVTLLVLIVVIVLIILLLLYYKKKYLKSDSKENNTPVSVSDTLMKEKLSEPEKKIEEPVTVSATEKDEPAIQETSFLESTVVKTSVGQPTTLVIGLPDANIPEITWKKDAEPVNHPVLPDGSLYIISTDHSDEGEYTVIINRKESTAFENLQLTVVNPQVPTVEKPGHSVIKIEDFTEHVALLKVEKDAKLTEEFELVVANVPFTQHAAKLLCNKSKNRYKNIIPYDHSRVVLSQQDQLTGSDYINASHVDGYGETRAYIAAQGPMNNSINDFWRMIWEQNVYTIVMLTRLVEDAKAKCQQYWPSKGSKVCGDIKITLHKEEQLANYNVRQFFVEQVSGVKSDIRLIYQFHFTAWPDHGVPKYATPLLEFQKKVDKLHKRKNNKPMLVHCSAGVGRSGTFIAIDTEIQHMKKQNVIDVYDTVRKMRFWRNYMVQTLSQYNFIHVALLEHIACGDTSIAAPINNVEEKIGELSKFVPETNKTGFQLQFEKLVRNSSKQTDFMYVAAVSPKNKNKNRCQKFLPPDTSRVIIPQIDGSSDYINFCFIDDYRQTKAFLAGPGPMQSTASDFWTMIWEKKSYAIVMLGQLKENGEEACFKYWPNENRTGEFGTFLVETISEDAWDKDIVKRTFKLTNTKIDDDARTITQLQYMEWSQNTCPDGSALVIDMIEVLERVQRKTGNGPITVHCSDGVGRSGAFCALMVSINRFKAEQMVDVFQTITNMRTQRPGIVANAEQFEFIHQGLINMIKRFSPYSNFTDGTAV